MADEQNQQILTPVDIESEMKKSYLDYAMSVILARAIPDVRDGLKPVQRRILIAMNDLGLASNRGFRKCDWKRGPDRSSRSGFGVGRA